MVTEHVIDVAHYIWIWYTDDVTPTQIPRSCNKCDSQSTKLQCIRL